MKTIKEILHSPSLTSDIITRCIAWAILVAALLLSNQSVIGEISLPQFRLVYMVSLGIMVILLLARFARYAVVQDIIDFAGYEAAYFTCCLFAYLYSVTSYTWLNQNAPYVSSSCFILTILRLVWFFPNKAGTQTMNWPIMGLCGAFSRYKRALPASERTHRWVVWGMIPFCFAVAGASTLVTFGWPSFSFAIVGIVLVAGYADHAKDGLIDTITERNSAVAANQQFEAMMVSKDEALEQLQARLSEELERVSYTREEIIAFIDSKLTKPERRLLANFALVDPAMQENLINFVYSYSKQPVVSDDPPPPKLTLIKGGVDTKL